MPTYSGRVEAKIVVPTGGASIFAVNVTTGPVVVTVPAGSYYLTAAGGVSSILTVLQTQLTATCPPASGGWTVSFSLTTGLVTIACTETYSITWTSTVLRDLLGFTANIVSATTSTGGQQARGLWLTGHPINLEGDPTRAPLVTDARQSMSPTGQTITLVGNTFRRHRGIVWANVEAAQVWDALATYENGSWEEFFSETQLGLGSSWFTPGSPIQIYWLNAGVDSLLGADATITGWSIVGVRSIEPQKSVADWTGYWRIELPLIVAAGS